MSLTLRTALTSLSLAFALPAAVAQPTSGRWGWAKTPFVAGQTQYVQAQAVDPVRHRLYLVASLDTTQQLNGASVVAGSSLHTFDAANGQWLSATPITTLGEGELNNARLTVDATSGDVVLAAQYHGTLHLSAQTLTTTTFQGLVARYSPSSGQWRWATQTSGPYAVAAESAVVLPGGDVAIAGSFVGDSLHAGAIVLGYPIGPYWVCKGFVARLDGATGQWQWATSGGGRDTNTRVFSANEPGNMHKVAFDATTNQLLMIGTSDTSSTFGTLPAVAAGAYLTRLNANTGQWVKATALPTMEGLDQLATDNHGNSYLAGTNIAETNPMFIARLNAADQLQWITREATGYTNTYYPGGSMWEAVSALSIDSWGNAFMTTHADCFALCGSSPGGMSYTPPTTPVAVFNFDTFTGTRLWRLASSDSYAYSTCITADEQGSAYVSGNYSMGNLAFDSTLLPTVSNQQARLFVAQISDAVTTSRVLAAPHDQAAGTFEVWPNPAHETVQLRGADANSATLLDAVGRVVRSAMVAPGKAQIDLNGLAPGVYSLRCGTAVRRLVIE
jgi:hypothetical protein